MYGTEKAWQEAEYKENELKETAKLFVASMLSNPVYITTEYTEVIEKGIIIAQVFLNQSIFT